MFAALHILGLKSHNVCVPIIIIPSACVPFYGSSHLGFVSGVLSFGYVRRDEFGRARSCACAGTPLDASNLRLSFFFPSSRQLEEIFVLVSADPSCETSAPRLQETPKRNLFGMRA